MACSPASDEAVRWLAEMHPLSALLIYQMLIDLMDEGMCKHCALNKLFADYQEALGLLNEVKRRYESTTVN